MKLIFYKTEELDYYKFYNLTHYMFALKQNVNRRATATWVDQILIKLKKYIFNSYHLHK